METPVDRPQRRLVLVPLAILIVSCGLWWPKSQVAARLWPKSEEAARIVELLDLRPGSQVADLGAGDGEWTVRLARAVDDSGHVYATEVKEKLVERIRQQAEDEGLENITVFPGDQESTGLPEGCCESALLRRVYHHFVDSAKMRASLKAALRPGGLVLVIEVVPQKNWPKLPGVPDRGGHGIAMETLIDEMTSDGFEVVSRLPEWEAAEDDNADEDDYGVLFRGPG